VNNKKKKKLLNSKKITPAEIVKTKIKKLMQKKKNINL